MMSCSRLLSIAIEMIKILLYSINRLIDFIHSLKVLIGDWLCNWLSEIRRNQAGCMWTKKSLEKLFDQFPTDCWNEAGSIVTLNENSFEVLILAHRHTAELHEEVTELKSSSFRLNLKGYKFNYLICRCKHNQQVITHLNHLLCWIEWIDF